MNRLISFFRNRFARVQERPIIVLGNQKSGTSAIAHLLADFSGLSKTIDIPPLWPPVSVQIMRGDIDFASIVERHRAYFSTELIKEPAMTFFVDQVLVRFPESKYVFVIRDARDNIRSLLNSRKLPGHLKTLEEHHLAALSPRRVTVNARVWGVGENESYIGVLAHRWTKAIDNYLLYSDRMILARYEDFIQDKVGFIARLAERIGLSQKSDISDKVDVQYQPRGNREISWEEFFGKENLMRIEQICGERMQQFGYVRSCESPCDKTESL